MQCANPPREWRKFPGLSSKSRGRDGRRPRVIRATTQPDPPVFREFIHHRGRLHGIVSVNKK